MSRAIFARSRLPGRSPALRNPRWYCTISVSSELWLDPARWERRESSRSSAWFIACRRSVRLAKLLVFKAPTLPSPASGGGEAQMSFDFRRWVGVQGCDVRCAGAEHGDPQLPGEAVEQAAHRLFAFRGRREDGMGEAGEVRPQADRLGGIEAVVQPAAGDQRQLWCRAMSYDQRLRRRDAPLGKRQGELDLLGPLPAEGLHAGKTRAAKPGDVDGGHAGHGQQPRGALRDAAADLLDDNRHGQLLTEDTDLLDQSSEVVIAFRLQRLLQWIEMQH